MNAQQLLSKYEKLAEAAHRTGAYKCARKWSVKAEKLEAVISALESVEEKQVIEVTVCDMRAAGKPGYVAKIVNNQKQFLQSRKADSFTTSAKNVHYEISEDGVYEICDANFGSRKRSVSFIEVKNGEIIKEAEKLSELQAQGIELPEIVEGSKKQIDWAFSIRQNLVSKLKGSNKEIPDWVFARSDAKFWIDNRSKF